MHACMHARETKHILKGFPANSFSVLLSIFILIGAMVQKILTKMQKSEKCTL